MTMPPTSFAALQARIDAVKRKCATGYSCGASCISMSKQCRKAPGAGPAQQKMTRILALAKPGAGAAAPSAEPQRPAEAPAAAGAGGGRAKGKPAEEQTLDQEISRLQKLQKAHEEHANRSGHHPGSDAREVIAGLQALSKKQAGKPLRWNIHGKTHTIPESKLQGLSPRQVSALIYSKVTGYKKPGRGQPFGDWFVVPGDGKPQAAASREGSGSGGQKAKASGSTAKPTSSTEKGGALARQQQPQERKRTGGSTADEKYAGKADDASVTAYAKEKVKELLNDPKQWENSEFVKKYTKDDYFGHATMVGDDAKARRAFNSFFQGQLKTRQAELDRGYSFATDRPEDIEKKLEKAKVSKAKNKAQNIDYLTKKLAHAKQAVEDARVFVEETYPRMNAMSNDEKVAYARERSRKRVDDVIGRGMRDLKSAARGGKEVAAVADFLRVEQGGRSKGVAALLGEDTAPDKDVIRAQLTGKGTAEGALGLQPGQKPTREALKSAYRKAAAKTHPDAGGSPEEFRMTQQAYERLKKKFKYDSLQARLDALRARCGV